jgi:LysR family transcriptional regulator for metE and metH
VVRIHSPSHRPRPRLDVKDLEVVLALAADGSTKRASHRLHLTQSATSRALLLVEEKLGVRLFERAHRGLSPTEEGERLIRGAAPLLAQLVELEDETRRKPAPLARVRIVCECYTAYRWMPSALAKMRAVFPRLEMRLDIEHTREPTDALDRGEVDIALLTTSPIRGDVREEQLFSDEIVFVVARSHPLARATAITADDLRTNVIITSPTPPAEAAWFLKNVFGRKTPQLDFLSFPLTEAVMDAARAGMGVAVMSEWIASTYLADDALIVKRFAGKPLRRPWRIAYRREAAVTAKKLRGFLETQAPRVAVHDVLHVPQKVARTRSSGLGGALNAASAGWSSRSS